MSGPTRGEHAAGGGHVAEFFDAGHEQFQALSSALWDPIGRASVAVARPAVGQRVLDACCGAGASAVPTAEAVGHAGAVDAVDLADRLLEHGRAAATEAGLGWIRFVRDDVTRFGEAASYDIVQCVLGVFLLPDMDAGTAHLIRLARPGGRVVVTTWAEGAIEPIRAAVGEVLPEERPELREPLSRPPPADRIQTPEALSSWLVGLGLAEVAVVRAPLRIPFDEGVVSSLFGHRLERTCRRPRPGTPLACRLPDRAGRAAPGPGTRRHHPDRQRHSTVTLGSGSAIAHDINTR